MRGLSWALIMATCRSSAIDVLFGVQSNGDIRLLGFQRGTTLKFQKNFRTFFVLILEQRHGVLIFCSTNQKMFVEWREILGKLFFYCLFWRHASEIPQASSCINYVVTRGHAFTMVYTPTVISFQRRGPKHTPSKHDSQWRATKYTPSKHCSCWLVKLEAVNKMFWYWQAGKLVF